MSAAGADLRVGLDVGGTKVAGVLLEEGAVRHRVVLPTERGPEGVLACATSAALELCAAAGTTPAALTGVGVGVPGIVDPRAGTVTHAVNLGLDEPVELAGVLSARLGGVHVTVENDLNVAALGAARLLGLGRGDLALLALGTGLAAGLLLDGTLRRGRFGAAGEIGHVPHDPAGPVCACGQRGCLELYASGSALDAAWAAVGGERDGTAPAPVTVFARAAAGDPAAVQVRDVFADAVAAAVRVLVLTCDVEHVVLGGGVSQLGAPLLLAVREALTRQAAGSAFLASLRIGERLQVVPPGALVGPVGAALAAVPGVPTSPVSASAPGLAVP